MKLNAQPIEKKTDELGHVDVHSIFYTIQGEGPFSGTPAVFLRLAGCNLKCPLCDTDYTSARVSYDSATLASTAELQFPDTHTGRRLVVITGGEPFRQQIGELIDRLIDGGCYVQVESNGTLPPPEINWSWMKNTSARDGPYLVISPKAGRINKQAEDAACAFKYVLREGNVGNDGLPLNALDHKCTPYLARPGSTTLPIYLQPADEQDPHRNQGNLEAAIDACLKFGYILQLQIHKIIDLD